MAVSDRSLTTILMKLFSSPRRTFPHNLNHKYSVHKRNCSRSMPSVRWSTFSNQTFCTTCVFGHRKPREYKVSKQAPNLRIKNSYKKCSGFRQLLTKECLQFLFLSLQSTQKKFYDRKIVKIIKCSPSANRV